MDVTSQVVILWAVNNGYLDSVPLAEISAFEEKILSLFTTNKKLKDHLDKNKQIDDFAEKELEKMLKSIGGQKTATAENTETKNAPKVRKVSKVSKAKDKRRKK